MGIHGKWQNNALLGEDGFYRGLFNGLGTFARNAYGGYDDFGMGQSDYVSTSAYAGWTVTLAGVGPTITQPDVVGGVLRLNTTAVNNEGIQMQALGESFLPAAGKDIYYEAKVRIKEVTGVDIFVGLALTDTSIVATNPADLIGFWVHDADDNLDFESSATAGAGAPVDTLTDPTDNAWIRLGFHVNGLTSVRPFINGVYNATAAVTTVANIPAVELTPSFACLCGVAGVAEYLDVDWYRICQMR